jgi:hypothetical protein
MMRHPGRKELFAYAEDLVNGQPLAARVGRHLKECPACRAEVEGVRNSLEFTAEAPELEASDALTAAILQGARRERLVYAGKKKRASIVWGVTKGLACAAALAVMTAMYFDVVSAPVSFAQTVAAQPTAPARLSESPAPELIEKAGAEIMSLTNAVQARPQAELSLMEREQRRAVLEQEEDIAAAMAALKRNPGNERAREVVNTNIQRGAKTLKRIYMEQSL